MNEINQIGLASLMDLRPVAVEERHLLAAPGPLEHDAFCPSGAGGGICEGTYAGLKWRAARRDELAARLADAILAVEIRRTRQGDPR